MKELNEKSTKTTEHTTKTHHINKELEILKKLQLENEVLRIELAKLKRMFPAWRNLTTEEVKL